jgi:hypothetical protein
MSELLVHYLAVAEFDVDKGCVLSAFYPESLQCNDEDYLAHLAFPDGCHLFREDWNYFVYRKGFKNLTETNAATSPTTESHEVTRSKYGEFKSNKDVELWGVAQFRQVESSDSRRGYKQIALLILTPYPYRLSLLQRVLQFTIHQQSDILFKSSTTSSMKSSLLQTIYETLNTAYSKLLTEKSSVEYFTLWNEQFSIQNVKQLTAAEKYPSLSITALVKAFGKKTMYLWYGLMTAQKVLILSERGSEASSLCMSTLLLARPLHTALLSETWPLLSLHHINDAGVTFAAHKATQKTPRQSQPSTQGQQQQFSSSSPPPPPPKLPSTSPSSSAATLTSNSQSLPSSLPPPILLTSTESIHHIEPSPLVVTLPPPPPPLANVEASPRPTTTTTTTTTNFAPSADPTSSKSESRSPRKSGTYRPVDPQSSQPSFLAKPGKPFLAGSTNPLFLERTDMFDTIASLIPRRGKPNEKVFFVAPKELRLSPKDKRFIKNIIKGIEDGQSEEWVRLQFKKFTVNFLLRLEAGALGRVKRQVFTGWQTTSYVYKKYKDLKNRKAGDSLEFRLSHRPSYLVLIKRNILRGADFSSLFTSDKKSSRRTSAIKQKGKIEELPEAPHPDKTSTSVTPTDTKFISETDNETVTHTNATEENEKVPKSEDGQKKSPFRSIKHYLNTVAFFGKSKETATSSSTQISPGETPSEGDRESSAALSARESKPPVSVVVSPRDKKETTHSEGKSSDKKTAKDQKPKKDEKKKESHKEKSKGREKADKLGISLCVSVC